MGLGVGSSAGPGMSGSTLASFPQGKAEQDFSLSRPRKRNSDGMSSPGEEADDGRGIQYNLGNHPDGGQQQFKRRRGNGDHDVERSTRPIPLAGPPTSYHQPPHGPSGGDRQQQQQQPAQQGGSFGIARIPSWRVDASVTHNPATATGGVLQQSISTDGEVRVVPRVREDGGSSDPQQWGTPASQDEPRLTCPVPICRQVFVGKQMIVEHMRTHNSQVCFGFHPLCMSL